MGEGGVKNPEKLPASFMDGHNKKSVNLQYITLGCLDDGTNELLTKSLMFEEFFL